MVNAWWKKNHSEGGYSMTFIQGIIKFCSYSDPNKKNLVSKWLSANELESDELESIGLKNWQEDISKEEFSQQAISVFGTLSIMDKPLIIIFDQLEALGEAYNENLLRRFGEAVKEIFTHVPNSLIVLNLFPQRWEHFQTVFDGAVIDRVSQEQIWLNFPAKDKLKEILVLNAQQQGIKLDDLFTPADLEDILNQNSIRNVLVRASDAYKYQVDGIPLPNRATTKLAKVKTTKSDIGPNLTEQLKILDEKITAREFEKNLSEQFKNLEEKVMAKGGEADIAEQLKSLEEKLAARSIEQTITEQLQTLEKNLSAKGIETGITDQLKSIEEKLTTRRFEEILTEEIKVIKQELMNLKTLMEELMNKQKSRPSVEEDTEDYSKVSEVVEEKNIKAEVEENIVEKEAEEKNVPEEEKNLEEDAEEKTVKAEIEENQAVTPKPDNVKMPASVIEDYINEHKITLSEEYDNNTNIFINDSDDLGKLITILQAFQTVKEGITFFHPELDEQEWQDYLIIDTPSKSVIIGFLHAEGKTFNSKLQISQKLLIEYYQYINHFGLFRDKRQRSLEEKENQELQQFRGSQKGFVSIIDKDKRVTFELAYQLVTDVLNKEEKFELTEALNTLESDLGEQNWLIRLLK
ncbi:exonuclease family protein [Beggiatoa sp. PS]|nr:exonuclease family protein [Beggiatoa sp. PS]